MWRKKFYNLETRKSNEVDIYGTGGTILADMKGLLLNLTGLKRLELIDLELEELDGRIEPILTKEKNC